MSGRGEAQSDSLVARPLLKLSTSRRASIVGELQPGVGGVAGRLDWIDPAGPGFLRW